MKVNFGAKYVLEMDLIFTKSNRIKEGHTRDPLVWFMNEKNGKSRIADIKMSFS